MIQRSNIFRSYTEYRDYTFPVLHRIQGAIAPGSIQNTEIYSIQVQYGIQGSIISRSYTGNRSSLVSRSYTIQESTNFLFYSYTKYLHSVDFIFKYFFAFATIYNLRYNGSN